MLYNVTHLSLSQEPKSKLRHEGETAATAREFDGTYNVQPKVYGTYAAEQYSKDRGGPPQHEGYEHSGPPPGSSRYSKFDYDPHEEERDPRGPYGGYPLREEESRHPRPLPRDAHLPSQSDYGHPPRDYPPLPGGRGRGMEEEEPWRREFTPPRMAARDFPPSGPSYEDPGYPPVRVRPPAPPDDYRGPPEQGDPYYRRPPPEPKRNTGIFSQMESIDYSHGGSSNSNVFVKSVDYHHGSQPGGGYSSMPREMPPGVANFPYSSSGDYSTYGESAVPGSYLPFGNPGGYTSASGLDPAAIFAAYQGGKQRLV